MGIKLITYKDYKSSMTLWDKEKEVVNDLPMPPVVSSRQRGRGGGKVQPGVAGKPKSRENTNNVRDAVANVTTGYSGHGEGGHPGVIGQERVTAEPAVGESRGYPGFVDQKRLGSADIAGSSSLRVEAKAFGLPVGESVNVTSKKNKQVSAAATASAAAGDNGVVVRGSAGDTFEAKRYTISPEPYCPPVKKTM